MFKRFHLFHHRWIKEFDISKIHIVDGEELISNPGVALEKVNYVNSFYVVNKAHAVNGLQFVFAFVYRLQCDQIL